MDLSFDRIKNASTGLLYMSEGDYPFDIVSLNETPSVPVDRLLELSGKANGTKVDVVTLEQFFKNMTKLPLNAGPEQKRTVERFVTLQQVLQEELSGIAVYLMGEVERDAFIIGKLRNGAYGGLRTKVIQT